MQKLYAFCLVVFLLAGCSSTPQSNPHFSQLHRARMGHAAVPIGDQIYVLGGSNDSGFLGDVEVIDTQSGQVRQLSSTLLPRRYFSAVWDGKESIYILGGEVALAQAVRLERRVEVLNIRSGDVSFAPNLPEPTRMNAAVRLNNEIWVLGGSDAHKGTLTARDLVAVYHLERGSWRRGPAMSVGKDVELAALNGQLYLVGGFNGKTGLKTVERLDTSSQSWHAEPELPLVTSANAVASCDNALVSFGDYQQMDRVMLWQPGSASWQQLQVPMLPARHASAVRVNTSLYLIGGNTGSSGPYVGAVQRFDCAELQAAAGL
ncbi:kelch repeat-containing protein [Rheinheimera sp.]|uniref:Kelch repeat-containing protein n=1 Tax=Rheinheimera sp. TaxID=1869214 RepID=UPI00307E057F